MNNNLIERLNTVEGKDKPGSTRWYRNPDGPEAAREIVSLQAVVAEYREVLRWYGDLPSEWEIKVNGLAYGDLYLLGEKARIALARTTALNAREGNVVDNKTPSGDTQGSLPITGEGQG